VGYVTVDRENESGMRVVGMKYVLAALSVSDGNHAAGNYWTSERCAEEIDILYDKVVRTCTKWIWQMQMLNLVDAVGLDCRIDQLGHEFALEVLKKVK
jgi:hypothetical protein